MASLAGFNQISHAECAACQPATMAGLLAPLDYVGQPEWLDGEDGATILSGSHGCDEDLLKEFPRTIAAALREMIG